MENEQIIGNEKDKDNDIKDNGIIGYSHDIIINNKTLTKTSEIDIQFALGKKLYHYVIQSDLSFKLKSTIEYTDDILSAYSLEQEEANDDVIIVGKSNKSISQYSSDSLIKFN